MNPKFSLRKKSTLCRDLSSWHTGCPPPGWTSLLLWQAWVGNSGGQRSAHLFLDPQEFWTAQPTLCLPVGKSEIPDHQRLLIWSQRNLKGDGKWMFHGFQPPANFNRQNVRPAEPVGFPARPGGVFLLCIRPAGENLSVPDVIAQALPGWQGAARCSNLI